MELHRQAINLRTRHPIQSFRTEQRALGLDDLEEVRLMLGKGGKTKNGSGGLALGILLDKFFLEWSNVSGRLVNRTPQPQ